MKNIMVLGILFFSAIGHADGFTWNHASCPQQSMEIAIESRNAGNPTVGRVNVSVNNGQAVPAVYQQSRERAPLPNSNIFELTTISMPDGKSFKIYRPVVGTDPSGRLVNDSNTKAWTYLISRIGGGTEATPSSCTVKP